MEPMDDFDSLLRAAAGEYNKTSFTESDVSRMIDERLVASKKGLRLQFKKEINIIITCLFFFIIFECFNSLRKTITVPPITLVQHVTNIGGILYMLVWLFMFKRLRQISSSQKDIHISNYIRNIYERTQQVINIYLWTSTGVSITMIAVQFKLFPHLTWYWALAIWLVLSVLVHCINVWYIRVQFGKRIQEMKELMEEFE